MSLIFAFFFSFCFFVFFKTVSREVTTGPVDDGLGSEVMSLTPMPSCQELPIKMHAGKPGKGEHESTKTGQPQVKNLG